MLYSVTDYVAWIFGTALPLFISSEPVRIIFALMCLSIALGFVCRFIRPPKI